MNNFWENHKGQRENSPQHPAVTKSGTAGTWDMGREDDGKWNTGTQGRGDVGLGDAGKWDKGTRGSAEFVIYNFRRVYQQTSSCEFYPYYKRKYKIKLNM